MSRYDRRLVEQLLPTVWDEQFAYGMENPTAPDPDMPKGTVNPKEGGTLFAHLADIRRAWRDAPLDRAERGALLLRFGLDWTHADIGAEQKVNRSTVTRRIERAVGVVVAHLNGTDFSECDSETEDYET